MLFIIKEITLKLIFKVGKEYGITSDNRET